MEEVITLDANLIHDCITATKKRNFRIIEKQRNKEILEKRKHCKKQQEEEPTCCKRNEHETDERRKIFTNFTNFQPQMLQDSISLCDPFAIIETISHNLGLFFPFLLFFSYFSSKTNGI